MTAGPKIKICGVTLADDAAHVAASGADYIGLNFWPRSKRYLEPERGALIASAARGAGAVQVVGVFVDASVDEITAVASEVRLDIIQLHGAEDAHQVANIVVATQRPVWKSIAVGTAADVDHLDAWPVDALLLDTPSVGKGGSGKSFDWSLAAAAVHANPRCRLMLAGGLDPTNVTRAIAEVAPWGVDVASGVEAGPGVKDAAKVTAFVAAVRGQSR
ncbi:MAG: phosphoribosylanthranilate isomerase [Myxococcales bacterium]|nr:phosphoribosylanthranilate isomerase [Myxococcales bacterium]